MEFGFPIWRGSGGVKYALREILRYGFDFVEIDLETLKPSEVKNSSVLKTGYHAPYTVPLSHTYLTSCIRKQLANLVKFANKTKAVYINMHVNYPTYRSLGELNSNLKREAVKTIKYLRKQLDRTIITLENPPKGDYWRCSSLLEIVAETRVKACLDVGHFACNLLKQADIGRTTREIKRCIKQSRGFLFLLHLHNVSQNTDGGTQDHMLEGYLDLVEIAATAIEAGCGYILLETFFKGYSRRREVAVRDVAKLMHRIKREVASTL